MAKQQRDPAADAIYARFRDAINNGYSQKEAAQYANTGVDPRKKAAEVVKPEPQPSPPPLERVRLRPNDANGLARVNPQSKPIEPKSEPDDLTMIDGIGPRTAEKLLGMGVTTYAQIAGWTDAEAKEFDQKLVLRGRVLREKWVDQAKQFVEVD
jgi:predicted flap endonuclease-1-like 5' DNA nuclease